MNQKLTPSTALMLVIPPLLWAGNAVVGRVVHELVPPVTLNFLRWSIALLILLPVGRSIYASGSGLWKHWKRYAILGLLGVGLYNALQYLALQTSSPVNVTLVGASMPVWMLVIGRMFFGATISSRQILGAVCSICGVLVILSHGELRQLLSLRFVAGDLYMIIATIIWALYSWLLTLSKDDGGLGGGWAGLLLAQITFGVMWSSVFVTAEWAMLPDWHIQWGWPLIAALIYVAVGPAVVAFRCWGLGVQRAGPSTAGFFSNLAPLFAAVLSLAFLGEAPHLHHALAFGLIVGGIVISSRRQG